jgi:DNA adenine methylase
MVNPILKWAGGKRELIPKIISLFPKDYRKRTYHEPFIGGGAVFFKIRPKFGSINDINSRLMNFYCVVRDKPLELIEQASQYSYNEKSYYKLRDRFNQPNLTDIEDAALLLYLNKTAFNGLYRVNSKGEFNVPFGRYKNPTIVPKRRIKTASTLLKNIMIFNEDFSYILEQSKDGDLCYFDPPYQPVSKTANFTSYSKKGFDLTDQRRLRDCCVDLDMKNVLFVVSNSYTDSIRDLYEEETEFTTVIVQAKRVISSKASTRGPVNEILVTNIPEELSIKSTSTLQSFIKN